MIMEIILDRLSGYQKKGNQFNSYLISLETILL